VGLSRPAVALHLLRSELRQPGKGAAAGVAAIVALLLPGPAMESWGWRIPFLLAIPLAALVLYLRLQVEDSPEYVASKAEHRTTEKPIAEVFRHYKAPLAKVISISLVQNIGTYVGTVFVAVYFSNVLGFSKGAASTIVLVAVLLVAALCFTVLRRLWCEHSECRERSAAVRADPHVDHRVGEHQAE